MRDTCLVRLVISELQDAVDFGKEPHTLREYFGRAILLASATGQARAEPQPANKHSEEDD